MRLDNFSCILEKHIMLRSIDAFCHDAVRFHFISDLCSLAIPAVGTVEERAEEQALRPNDIHAFA